MNSEAEAVNAGTQAAVQRAFDRLQEIDPLWGTRLGAHEHDGRLAQGGREDVEAEASIWRTLAEDVSDRADLDADVARYLAGHFRFTLEELRLWEGVDTAGDEAGTAIFLLFTRDHLPLEQRLESVVSRLADLPRFLRQARERVTRPVRLWNEVALEGVRALPSLFETVASAPVAERLRARLAAAAEQAAAAATEHADWIEKDLIPRGRPDPAIGEELFARVLETRLLPTNADDLLALGRRYLSELTEEREELVSRSWPSRSDVEVLAEIQADRAADFETCLREYRQTMAAARDFVRERRLMRVPDGEEIEVIETPAFMRPLTPFAAYEPPAYFEQRQLGLYYVTPPVTPEDMAENNRTAIVNTSVHEAYPGHHLQLVCGNSQPSLARALSAFVADEFVEGWAHYCEQLMYEEGFQRTPELRLVQLNDLIWRACRVILDVELSRGRMSPAEGIRLLATEARMDPNRAAAEVYRYTFTPGYQLSYLYGRHLLLQLRDKARAEQGAAFQLDAFHDRLLYAGSLPAALWARLF